MTAIDRLKKRRAALAKALRQLKPVKIPKRFKALRRRLEKTRIGLRQRIAALTRRIKKLQQPSPSTDHLGDGPDVSMYQGNIDWKAVRTRYKVAFTKATEGRTYTDPTFNGSRLSAMTSAGLRVGLYHFARPDLNSAADEASHFVSAARNAGTRFISFTDWKHGKPGQVGALDFEHVPYSESWAAAWGQKFEQLTGVKALLYGGGYSLNPVLGALDNFAGVWLAAYVSDWHGYFNGPDSAVKFWQWTSSGTCPGISGNVDLNHYLG